MSTVSILIPCHNAAPWLASTVKSALAQTWPHCDIIIVDDGSTDDSLAIARSYAARGVRAFPQPNRGASAARNAALREARGAFIQFLDADDQLAPDKIERQIRMLRENPGRAVASGPWSRFATEIDGAHFKAERNWASMPAIDWLALNFAGEGMMPPAAWLAPREAISAAGPWDERLSLNDDGEYFCRVLLAAGHVIFCEAARTYYRSGVPGTLSDLKTRRAWESAFLSHQLCAQHLLSSEDSARTRRAGADLFQRLAFAMFPDCPDLVARCEDEVQNLGGSAQQAEGGRAFRIAARLGGWKMARRLQRRALALRARSSRFSPR